MKDTIRIAAIAALIGTPALAADIAVKAPPPAPAPVYSWTGWYAGVNAGASFGNVDTDFNVAPGTVVNRCCSTLVTIPGFAASDTVYPSGFMGGGQIGYNWQFSPIWVVGFEADFQGAVERDSATPSLNSFNFLANFGTPNVPTILSVSGTTVADYQATIDWFGTVRGRIGYVWGDGAVLTYVTGGLAYGKVDLEGTSTVSGLVGGVSPFSVAQAFGHSHVNTGWVVGYGTEGVIDFWGARNWTWKIESLWMDLGHLDTATSGANFVSISNLVSAGPVAAHTHFTDGILRAGLNYKFY